MRVRLHTDAVVRHSQQHVIGCVVAKLNPDLSAVGMAKRIRESFLGYPVEREFRVTCQLHSPARHVAHNRGASPRR